MKSVQFTGENFNEIVNFCINSKVKFILFELRAIPQGQKYIILKTTKNDYKIWYADLIFLKRSKLSQYHYLSHWDELQSKVDRAEHKYKEPLPII